MPYLLEARSGPDNLWAMADTPEGTDPEFYHRVVDALRAVGVTGLRIKRA